MQPTEQAKFAAMLLAAAEMYGKTLSDGVIEIYWQTLQGYELADLQRAFQAHFVNPDTGQFFPKPADIVRMIEGSTQSAAAVAWSKVEEAVKHVGTYRDVVFDDPLIHRVIQDLGGWIQLGTKTLDEWPFIGNDFQNRYRAYRQRRVVPEYPPKLIGQANGHNSSHGFALEPPAYVGNRDRCALIEQRGRGDDKGKQIGGVVISLIDEIKNQRGKDAS